jgi:hypothetical protein
MLPCRLASNHTLTLSAFKQPQQIFLQTVKELPFMAPLDHALANSHPNISPWNGAKDWLDADMNQVTSIIQEFVASTESAEVENANFGGDMINQVRLTVIIQICCLNTDHSV